MQPTEFISAEHCVHIEDRSGELLPLPSWGETEADETTGKLEI